MYKQFYESLSFAWLPMLTMLFFLGVFASALLRLFVFNKQGDYDAVAALPLQRDEEKS